MLILKHIRLNCYYGGKKEGKHIFTMEKKRAETYHSIEEAEEIKDGNKLLKDDYEIINRPFKMHSIR